MTDVSDEYESSWIADFIHQFPHFDLSFQLVNSTFNLHDRKYLESLIIWSALPVVCLLLTLVIFLFYFCYRCCQRDAGSRKGASCLKCWMVFFVLLACGTLGVGFYGNEEMKKGDNSMYSAASEANDIVSDIHKQVTKLKVSINETVANGTREVNRIYDKHPRLDDARRTELITQTKQTFDTAAEVLVVYDLGNTELHKHSDDLPKWVKCFKDFIHYRYLTTTACLCWLTLLCFLLLLGVSKTSKCTLLLFCTFGIFSLVLCWLAAGAHLGVSLGLGDFCVEPNDALEDTASHYVEREYVSYYLHCKVGKVVNPFKDPLQEALEKVKDANDTLNSALTTAHKYISKSELDASVQDVYSGLSELSESIVSLTVLSECSGLHQHYSTALKSFCHKTLLGVTLLTLSCVTTAFLFTLLVLMSSRAWRSFGAQDSDESYPKTVADTSEEEGPFLPRPAPTAPYHYGSPAPYGQPSQDYVPHGRGNAQVLALQRQANQPPPYSSTEFYHQYNDAINPAMYAPYGQAPARPVNA